jgi:hypothetical protein
LETNKTLEAILVHERDGRLDESGTAGLRRTHVAPCRMGLAYVTKVVAANGDPSLELIALERSEFLHEGGVRFNSCLDVVRFLVDSSKREVEMCVLILVD